MPPSDYPPACTRLLHRRREPADARSGPLPRARVFNAVSSPSAAKAPQTAAWRVGKPQERLRKIGRYIHIGARGAMGKGIRCCGQPGGCRVAHPSLRGGLGPLPGAVTGWTGFGWRIRPLGRRWSTVRWSDPEWRRGSAGKSGTQSPGLSPIRRGRDAAVDTARTPRGHHRACV